MDLNPVNDFDVIRAEMLPQIVHVGEIHGALDALVRLIDVVDALDVLVEMRLLTERCGAHLQE